MSDHQGHVAEALAQVIPISDSPQQRQLAEDVARHIAAREDARPEWEKRLTSGALDETEGES